MSWLKGMTSAAEVAVRLAQDIEWQWRQAPGLTGSNEPIHDAMGSLSQHLRSLSSKSGLRFGVVVDCIPYTQTYRVQPEAGGQVLDCCRLMQVGGTPLGVADNNTLQCNTHVWYIQHPTAPHGLIVGIEPPFMYDARRGMSDMVSQGSNVGLHVDPCQREAFKLQGDGGITDWSARGTVDSLEIGEFTQVAETGLALHLDSYMGMLRVSEMCGIWVFYWDQLCRIAGRQLQIWSSGSSLESYDDEGEHFWLQGLATYPWEHLGQLNGPMKVAKERNAEEVQLGSPWYSRIEPEDDNLQPFHRLQQFGGYLGQAKHTFLATPYTDGGSGKQLYSDKTNYTGLFEEVLTLGGVLGVRSAVGLSFGKRPVISIPKQLKLPNDQKDGDNKENYKASSQFGEGDPHKVKPVPAAKGINQQWQRVGGVLDFHAHLFNWAGAHPFHYHEEDWHLPEESEAEKVTTNQEVPEFGKLFDQWYLEPPPPVEVKLDHRDGGTVMVFPNSSHLTFLDDGGVILGDGFGSEIIMTGGAVEIKAAGDIVNSSGRNVITLAGRDAIIRANKSVDVTATKNDVRLKAEKNMQIIGANGGETHGVLIESRCKTKVYPFEEPGEECTYSGIILRSINSEIVGWAQDIYLRSGTESPNGDIVLDASEGKGYVISNNSVNCDFSESLSGVWIGTKGEFTHVHSFGRGAILDGNCWIQGGLTNGGTHLAEGSVLTATGHFFSPNAESQDGKVSQYKDPFLGQGKATIAASRKIRDKLLEFGKQTYKDRLKLKWYPDQRPGSEATIQRGAASCRVHKDYKVDQFIMFEPRWSQLTDSQPPDTWTEKNVPWNGTPTYPFPGDQKLFEAVYYQQKTKLHDVEKGIAKDRGSDYEEPEYEEASPVKLDGNHPTVG